MVIGQDGVNVALLVEEEHKADPEAKPQHMMEVVVEQSLKAKNVIPKVVFLKIIVIFEVIPVELLVSTGHVVEMEEVNTLEAIFIKFIVRIVTVIFICKLQEREI